MLKDVALTHPGNVRSVNEDTVASDIDQGLWLVADGMGGHAAGDVASQVVAETTLAEIRLGHTLSDSIALAHNAVAAKAVATNNQAVGMGSTVVALHIKDNQAQVVWVGDSRAYLWRKNKLTRLSKDHSIVQEMVDAGEIHPDAAAYHPKSNIVTQVLGLGEPQPDLRQIELHAGDWLLLCSDGLWGEVTEARLAELLQAAQNIDKAAKELMQTARSGTAKDNISLLLVENDKDNKNNNNKNDSDNNQPTTIQRLWPLLTAIGVCAVAAGIVLAIALR